MLTTVTPDTNTPTSNTIMASAQPSVESTDRASGQRRFWMLLSPALPIGGFSYSHGVEGAVAQGIVHDLDSTRDWITSLALRVLPTLELPLVARLLDCANRCDQEGMLEWNDTVLATRESRELQDEERGKGEALTNLLPALQIEPAVHLQQPSFAAAFALVCSAWQIDSRDALAGYAWVWFETLLAAAIKLVPLGHSDGQRLLLEMVDRLDELAELGLACADSELGAGAPGLTLLSAAHETQHARLFKS